MKKKLLLTLAFILIFGGGIWLGFYIRSQTINPQATLPNAFERILNREQKTIGKLFYQI